MQNDIDAYIADIIVDEYPKNRLFILADKYSSKISFVYSNPIELIRNMWQQHVLYANDTSQTYNNTYTYLLNKVQQLGYGVAERFISQLELKKTIDEKDINNLSLLFLVQHSSLNDNLVFGFVDVPKQTKMLEQILTDSGFKYAENIVENMLYNADNVYCGTLSAVKKI